MIHTEEKQMVSLNLELGDTALDSNLAHSGLAGAAVHLVSTSVLILGNSGNCRGWESSSVAHRELEGNPKLVCPDSPYCRLFYLPT